MRLPPYRWIVSTDCLSQSSFGSVCGDGFADQDWSRVALVLFDDEYGSACPFLMQNATNRILLYTADDDADVMVQMQWDTTRGEHPWPNSHCLRQWPHFLPRCMASFSLLSSLASSRSLSMPLCFRATCLSLASFVSLCRRDIGKDRNHIMEHETTSLSLEVAYI